MDSAALPSHRVPVSQAMFVYLHVWDYGDENSRVMLHSQAKAHRQMDCADRRKVPATLQRLLRPKDLNSMTTYNRTLVYIPVQPLTGLFTLKSRTNLRRKKKIQQKYKPNILKIL